MSLGWRLKSSNHVIQILCRVSRLTASRKPLVLFLKVLDDIRSNTFLYIKILVSEQRNTTCEIALKYHKIWIIRNDKKDYNSEYKVIAIFT